MPDNEVRLVVVGSGSLARSVCCSLAAVAGTPIALTVLARSAAAAAEVAYLTRTRAALAGRPVTAAPAPLADLAGTLGRIAPDVVLVVASYQSPWERTGAPTAWTDLMARAGFGATLPLQAALVADVARALAARARTRSC